MKKAVDYSTRIPKLMEELRTKTLSEAEKDTLTPDLSKLEKLIASMG